MSDLLPRFMRFVEARGLVREGDHVLVALSGGVDSVVLLHLLNVTAESFGISLHAAHLDHAMRAESAADAEWVEGLCKGWQIPVSVVRAEAALENEADAREARYRFLYDTARAKECARIATAHHADDQIETVLFRMMRGTGTRGLAGIPIKRDRLIRPLLRFHKHELEAYARENGLNYREDATNRELHYTRNRIRHVVIPAMEQVQPGSAGRVLALARHAARSERAWSEAIAQLEKQVVLSRETGAIELARPVLLEYDADLRARVIRQLLRRFGVEPGRAQTRHILEFVINAQSGAALLLPRHVRLERRFDRVRIERERGGDSMDQFAEIRSESGSAAVVLAGHRYVVEWKDVRGGPFEIRSWRAGDRIRLPYGTKKLKKLFVEHRIPASLRASIPVIADLNGRVVSVPGIAHSIDDLNITVTNA